MVPPIDAALTAQFPANSLLYAEMQGKNAFPASLVVKNAISISCLCPSWDASLLPAEGGL
jgi:hypothetical protein